VNLTSNWVYLVGFEMAIVLLVACIIFLGHIRGLRKLVAALEQKVLAQRDAMRNTRATFDALKEELEALRLAAANSYSDQLQEQLDATRNRHVALSPDRDIVLDITQDTPLERQALALRHAFLIAEREAALAADDKDVDWDVLQAKLGQIIQFYQQDQPGDSQPGAIAPADAEFDVGSVDVDVGESGDNDELIANQKRHIANLEKFRQLYFDVERNWREARAEAEDYHQQLLAMGKTLGGGVEFDALLQQYAGVYSGLDGLLEGGGQQVDQPEAEHEARGQVGKMVIANQEEVQRLRNMAIDQHKIIVELKRKLVGNNSADEQEHLVAEMHQQLERNERFLKESDACIQQLEAELVRLLSDNQKLKTELRSRPENVEPAEAVEGAPDNTDELEMLRGLITSFTEQSRDMLGAIAVLEEDNRRLMTQGSGGDGARGEVTALTERLSQAQQELLSLQTRHLELEERYLELKMQTK
jgi:hypothetical protein